MSIALENFPSSAAPAASDLLYGDQSNAEKAMMLLKVTGFAVASIAALRAVPVVDKDGNPIPSGTKITVLGYYAAGDGGGGPVRYWASGAAPGTYVDNGGSIIVPAGGDGSGAWLWAWEGEVDPLWGGAYADGAHDDGAAIATLLTAGFRLNGYGRTYLLLTNQTVISTTIRMSDFKFTVGTSYTNQGTFLFYSSDVRMRHISIDGERNTRSAYEPWTVYGTQGGMDSIKPIPGYTISIGATDHGAKIVFEDIVMTNLCGQGITVTTYGTCIFRGLIADNVAWTPFHVYHSNDNGTTIDGRTIASDIVQKNVAQLPTTFLIDGVTTNFSSTTGMPQDAYGCIVTWGDYFVSNAKGLNYGTSVITADRNNFFKLDGLSVESPGPTSTGLSNNPSGALWLESPTYSEISNVVINVQARDSRDLNYDSSAIQVYLTTGQYCSLSNISIIGNASSAQLKKGIRGSGSGAFNLKVTNLDITGLYSTGAFYSLSVANDVRAGELYLHNVACYSASPFGAYDFNRTRISNSLITGNFSSQYGSSSGVTGTMDYVDISQSRFINSVTIQQTTVETRLTSVGVSGALGINVAYATCDVILTGCDLRYTTTISQGHGLTMTGCSSIRLVQTNNVMTVSIAACTLKTDHAEPIIWINPALASQTLAGQITGNSLYIKTGTASAGYITIGANAANVTESNDTKQTIAW